MPYTKESNNPLTKEELTDLIFDTTYTMDLNNVDNAISYDCLKLEYIALFEGKEKYAYDDAAGPKNPYKYAKDIFAAGRAPVGKITVEAGFNMDRPEARGEWKSIFGDELDFDKVYRGEQHIEDDQILRLLRYSVNLREKELARQYGDIWTYLRPNEKIAIISAYYNGPSLVSKKTRFFANLQKYIKTKDAKYLQEAIIELRDRNKNRSLLFRRTSEAKLLDSTQSPVYGKPGDKIPFNGPIRVIQEKTRLPRDIEKHIPAVQNSEFVIWRTRLDGRVRAAHMRMEGKVYRRDDALKVKGEDGCRCDLVDVPNNLVITDDEDNIVYFYSWIKYSGASTFILT